MRTLNFILLGLITGVCYTIVANDGLLKSLFLDLLPEASSSIKRSLASIVLTGLFIAAKFLLLGSALYGLYHLHRKKSEIDVSLIPRWPVMLTGLGLAIVLCGMRVGRLPDLFTLALPWFASLLGVWIASNCLRGFRTAIYLIPKLLLLMLVGTGIGYLTLYSVTSNKSLAFEPVEVSAEDKSRLAKLIRRSKNLGDGRLQLNLTETDVNLMMAAAFERLPINGKAITQLRDGTVELELSLEVPFGASLGRYMNSHGIYRLTIEEGEIDFQPLQLSIGERHIPTLLLDSFGDFIVNTSRTDKNASAVIASMDRVRFADQSMEMVCESDRLRQELKIAFQHYFGASNDVVNAISSHARQLVDSATSLPEDDRLFSAFLRSAFTFAKKRSLDGGDPVIENRAAIMALAIVLGHDRVESLVGEVTDDNVKARARKYRGKVTLRGRRDWTRHFFVSASLALAFNSDVSDGAGIFKEEIDSARGGSGFSFSDLLADRAGVRLAMAATRDRKSAERIQRLLTSRFVIGDVFPPAADLPEGLSEAVFLQEFGGVHGVGYNRVLAEIERRLDTCRVLSSPD